MGRLKGMVRHSGFALEHGKGYLLGGGHPRASSHYRKWFLVLVLFIVLLVFLASKAHPSPFTSVTSWSPLGLLNPLLGQPLPPRRTPPTKVTPLAALPQPVTDRQSLIALSQQMGLSRSAVLLRAQQAELAPLLGAKGADLNYLRLVQALGIERPQDLARYRGQEHRLALMAGAWARGFGFQAPTEQEVAGWIAAAQGKTSALPAVSTLLPELMPKAAPAPIRDASFAAEGDDVPLGGGGTTLSAASTSGPLSLTPIGGPLLAAPTGGTVTGAPAAAAGGPRPRTLRGAPGPVVSPTLIGTQAGPAVYIPSGQNSCARQFPVVKAGLYRATITLIRPRGVASLKWSVEKPQTAVQVQVPSPTVAGPLVRTTPFDTPHPPTATVTVTGWTPLITGGSQIEFIDEPRAYYAYFWVAKEEVPSTGALRFALEVVTNLDKQVQTGGIDTVERLVPANGPVQGTLVIAEQPLMRPGLDKPTMLSFYNRQNPPASGPPLYLFEAAFQPNYPTHKDGTPASLDIVLSSRVGVQPVAWPDLEVLCNGEKLSPEVREYGGELRLRCPAAKVGNYNVLLSTDPVSLAKLRTTGLTYKGDYWTEMGSLERVTLNFDSQAGGLPFSYVAELRALEVSDQSEPDDDDMDDGDGEFHICSTISRLRTPSMGTSPEEQEDMIVAGTKASIVQDAWPTWGGSVYIRQLPAPDKRNVIFPRWPVAQWTENDLKQYNRIGVSLSILEEDYPTTWAQIKMLFEVLNRLGRIIISVWKGDLMGATEAFVEHIYKTATGMQFEKVSDTWDNIGYPAYVFDSQRSATFSGDPKVESVAVEPIGPGDVNVCSFQPAEGGWETAMVPGGGGHWARASLLIRKVPTYWVKSSIHLLSFTLSDNLHTDPNASGEIWVVKEPIIRVGLYDNRFLGATDYKEIGPYAWAHNPVIVSARAGEKVVVDKDQPPWQVTSDAEAYMPGACFYCEWHIFDRDPGGGASIFRFNRTFHYADFVKNAAPSAAQAADILRDLDPLTGQHKTRVRYYRQGPYYIGYFVMDDPGGYLKQLELKVYVKLFGS